MKIINSSFTPDSSIQQLQSSLKIFGKFDMTPVNLPPDKIQVHDVKTKTDIVKSNISGMYRLPEGQIVIVDNENSKVKQISASMSSVIAELDLPLYPQDICTTTGTELVVTVKSVADKELVRSESHFINVAGGHLIRSRIKQLDHQCIGVACHNSQLYVDSIQALYEYTLSGKKRRKIYEDTLRKCLTVFRFAVNQDGNRIYVTNYDQSCLVTLDKSGQQLSALTDPELQRPCDVCVADIGTVFVSGKDSHTVIRVDSEGKKKRITFATQSDGVNFPRSLCYDRNLEQLFVGQLKSDNLLLLKLN